MRSALAALLLLISGGALHAQTVVQASAPGKVSVTVYRDPDRADDEALDREWPGGFAMISETRTVTIPAGKSTIRFPGVAESMASVTALVTGLPSGVIEKNRDAALLSPGSLVDGSLGNRVIISRTNPATGQTTSEEAIIRTRADGGLVLQTKSGFEALRCSGLPEKLSYGRVPDGLSATPQFTINVDAPTGGTYQVVLSYLAGGFDWQAHYVVQLQEGRDTDEGKVNMLAWLTLANDNGQSFPQAELLAVAGKINIETNPSDLEERPSTPPLSLTCFGNPLRDISDSLNKLPQFAPVAAPAEAIVVTGSRIQSRYMSSPVAVVAVEEQLGDLKLYRVPEPVTVASKSLKQIAFMQREGVRGSMFHFVYCLPYDEDDEGDVRALSIGFKTRNDRAHGLGLALPGGMMSLFAPSSSEDLLLGEGRMNERPVNQDVELVLYDSSTAFGRCSTFSAPKAKQLAAEDQIARKEIVLSNANNRPILTRVILAENNRWRLLKKPAGRVQQKYGYWVTEIRIPAGGRRKLDWIVQELDD